MQITLIRCTNNKRFIFKMIGALIELKLRQIALCGMPILYNTIAIDLSDRCIGYVQSLETSESKCIMVPIWYYHGKESKTSVFEPLPNFTES